jgi:hypothetical protein
MIDKVETEFMNFFDPVPITTDDEEIDLDTLLPHSLRVYMISFLSLKPAQRFILTPGGDLQRFSTRLWDKYVYLHDMVQ